jgi:hypothetical protein
MESKAMKISDTNITLTMSQYDGDGMGRSLKKLNFQLHFLSDVPILTFQFEKPGDVVFFPIHFASFNSWPMVGQLPLIIQLCNTADHLTAVRHLVLSEDDTAVILQARDEQLKMTSRQVDSIIDLISPEFLGLTELSLLEN